MPSYRYCIVPKCKNTTVTAPEKLFFSVPREEKMRKKWCVAMKRDEKKNVKLSSASPLYCCEDHFKLEDDMMNYWQYKLAGNVRRLQLKAGVIPHLFECQKQPICERQTGKKRRRDKIIQEAKHDLASTLEIKEHELASQIIQSEDPKASTSLDEPIVSTCETSSLTIGKEDRAVQVNKPHWRSKGITVKPEQTNAYVSPLQRNITDTATSPFKLMQVKRKLNIVSEDESSVTSLTESTTTSDEYYQTSQTEYVTDEEEANNEFKKQMLEGAMAAAQREPKLLLGVPKECYYIVEMLSIKSSLPVKNIFITLRKIRLNETFAVLSVHFGMSASNVSRIFSKSVPRLEALLKQLIIWPEKNRVQLHLPIPFRARYSKTRTIIDCLEIEIEKPSHSVNQALTWSEYKGCNTIKYLISCTPDGLVNFISSGYGGRASDVTIVEECGFLEKLSPGDAVMADRGFKNISHLLEQRGCSLIRPPSVSKSIKSTAAEVKQAKRIAALRIHVERVISRVREFNMLLPHVCVDHHLISMMDGIITIVCGLINVQNHLIKIQL